MNCACESGDVFEDVLAGAGDFSCAAALGGGVCFGGGAGLGSGAVGFAGSTSMTGGGWFWTSFIFCSNACRALVCASESCCAARESEKRRVVAAQPHAKHLEICIPFIYVKKGADATAFPPRQAPGRAIKTA
jgi:hypothetical protein